MPNKLSEFWQELKRRNVFRVITVYAASSFAILELVDILAPALGLPDWTLKMVLILLIVGFIIAVIVSWIYDVHPEGGVVKTGPADKAKSEAFPKPTKSWKIASIISFVVIVGLIAVNIFSASNKSRKLAKLEKSIAVLPFENWDSDVEYMYLGDAIADEIIMQLQHINEFDRVLSRSSTMQYKTNRPSIPEIGLQLGVNYIIEGSIQRQKDNVSIRIQVIRAVKEDHIWAEEYEGKWSDIYVIQDDIAKNVAKQLKIVLSQNEIDQIEKRPTDNLEAYNYYLEGNTYYWRSYEEQDWTQAIHLYQSAIELDSAFTLAYTQLARSYLQLFWFHFDRTEQCLSNAREAIDAAFKLEPDSPDAQYTLGSYYYQGYLDYENALIHLNRAIAEAPNKAEYLYMTGAVYRRMGDFQRAEEIFLKAIQNDPGNSRIVYNAAQTYYLTGEYLEALKYIDITLQISPDFANVYTQKIELYQKWKGNTEMSKNVLEDASKVIDPSLSPDLAEKVVLMDIYDGKYKKALDYLNSMNFEAIQPQFFYYPKYLYHAYIYDETGDLEKARSFYDLSRIILEDRLASFPDDSRLYSSLGISYAGLGEKEKAIDYGKIGVDLLPLSKESWRGYYRLVELAQIYVMVGEYDQALEKLDFLLSVPGVLSPALLRLETRWRPLWDHPEFIRLIEKYSIKQ